MNAEHWAAGTSGVLANVPNAISASRLLSTPVLLVAAVTGRRELFTWLFLCCLLSRVADGLIARGFGPVSRVGALLDSTADVATTVAAVAGIVAFEPRFIAATPCRSCPSSVCTLPRVVAAIWRYGRISSFHTHLSGAAVCPQGSFVMALFLWGEVPCLFACLVVLSTVAYLEELALVIVLPRWTADVDGLYRVWGRGTAPR